jgi:hypothetical protein
MLHSNARCDTIASYGKKLLSKIHRIYQINGEQKREDDKLPVEPLGGLTPSLE